MHEPLDITTIIFALLAVFVVWKLRSVLGARTGNEKQRDRPFGPRAEETARQSLPGGNVIRLPGAPLADGSAAAPPKPDVDRWKDLVEPDSRALPGLEAIAAAEAGFDARAFLAGAKSAYEMIVTAFAKGDRATLRRLLADDVYESFTHAISDREGRGERVEMTFVSLEKVTIDDAQAKGPQAHITVRFLSKLITATYNKEGAVIDGNAERVVDMTDIWTFAREIGSRDPNWRLVATETGH
ncbi:MAG: Tim44 domain-containing protein [Methylobacteriaceae bacterium]|nr:Tim44 domain-containing protein [Methylobacteriaceae bacterium]